MSSREDTVGRIRRSRHPAQDGYGAGGSCPTALRLPDLGYRGLQEDPVGRISVAPSGTKAGMAPEVSCPAALRLPGLRYMRLRGARDNVIGMQLY
ncbi:hypothetical protein CWN47_34560 [Klebsiella variicola]|uniref:Uncharacterized protein n=1 Tax=Klebsiella variicola TaxID=244366 RepID=A0A2N4YQ95_KLEVA|nr:hypothetical protein CWN47_34560 [Klebsiella variicola]